ncbi:DJ-1/PfpI family protein [Methanococcoides orientis]|uniref:DJ-1/PfpI family protein n=1 Tax=Methanococcoides orientis TaxID=2822137 RepID=UPI001E3B92D5|nr:DJ-1/PfpI family protein [Methanococcoides orientis]UGV40964.1 DJ-1/PfpI family protein [Methanococcoides orientis]
MTEQKKILMIVAQENFRDEEFFEPKEVFEKSGAKVTVASNTTKKAKGILGGEVKPDLSISDVNIDEYDAISITGGGGSRQYLWNNNELQDIVKKAYEKGKVVAAICISPVVLANAGVLEGKKSTVFKNDETVSILKDKGAKHKDKGVISDGKIVTGRDPKSAKEYGKAVLKAFN